MRKTTLKTVIAVLLLGGFSTALGAAPKNMEAANDPGGNNQSDAREQETPPGKILDPKVVAPDNRTPYSGAPADWQNSIKDSQPYSFIIVDRLEYGESDQEDTYLWDAQGWIGGDINKFWWKTEGEGPAFDNPEDAEFQALYNRTISPFWGVQAGLRYNTRPGPEPDTAYAVIGLQGLAPYWFETDTSVFVSENGDLSFRGEFEYDLLLTQRLILQPRLEFNVSASDVPELRLGEGLNNTELGLRLRYEIRREFAPYIGVRWERLYGDTRDLAKGAGESTSETSLVLGLRAWF